MSVAHPFLKWVGGKTQIIDKVFEKFPSTMTNYFELFIGGGSVLIELLNRLENKTIHVNNIYINDCNRDLIDTYLTIKNNCDKLVKELEMYSNHYNSVDFISAKEKRAVIVPKENIDENIKLGKDYVYYFYRKQFNEMKNKLTLSENDVITKSALLIFINKTCFRGLYREGRNGKFNVPFGNYKNVKIYDKDNINKISCLLNKYKVHFTCNDFNKVNIVPDSFVYLDPPYYPENSTSFTDYNTKSFGKDKHEELCQLCINLDKNNNKFLLSNSDTEYIKKSLQFHTTIIKCKRSINSKDPGAKTNEILITNIT